jgi:DNA-binding NtrC family response regulator
MATNYGPTCASPGHHKWNEVMPARIVVVHDDQEFTDQLAVALRSAGHDVATFPDPLASWGALEAARLIEVLVTGMEYAPGRSNGLALARMARSKRPQIKVLFADLPEYAAHAADLGEFLAMPVSVEDTIEAITRLLDGQNKI